MAWTAAILALPEVVKGIDAIVTEIGELSKRTLTPKADLQKQKEALNASLVKLLGSLGSIGISIRDYIDIYAVTIQEETTVGELLYNFSLWNAGKMKQHTDGVWDTFKELKKIDAQVGQLLLQNEREIESDDFQEITNARYQMQQLFFSVETDLNKSTSDSWEAAYNNVAMIHTQTGNINSILVARFKKISTTLINTALTQGR